MPAEPPAKPSFSPYRQWAMAAQVGVLIVIVFAVVVMVNYLSHEYNGRWHLSARTKNPLSAQTVRFLQTVTNQVKVTLYYDKDDALFSMVKDLAEEYRRFNPRLAVQVADYKRDPATAQAVKANYKLPNEAKDLIIFDCEGRVKVFPGTELAQYAIEKLPNGDKPFRRKLAAFLGENLFTKSLVAITNPKLPTIYFLTGHDEHAINSGDELKGYLQCANTLRATPAVVTNLSLVQTKTVPADCDLLVVAGPTKTLLEPELQSIDQYLEQGGRLLVLFNYESVTKATGLEKLLAKWGVDVGANVVVEDRQHSSNGADVIVSAFSLHPLVKNLLNSGLYLLRPRSISALRMRGQPADAPRVEQVAVTSTNAALYGQAANVRQAFPLVVAVEKGAIKDVNTQRGTTRIVVVGDSLFLGNGPIDELGNRDFAGYAANWLLERPQLLQGPGPRPVADYRLVMSSTQLQSAEWILLAAMPGAVLLAGVVVWARRRK